MSVSKFAIGLCALGAGSLCLAATPASSQMSSPPAQGGAPGQILSGQVASGFPAAGAAFKKLTAEWEQWVLSIPEDANPLLDPTGENCMVGQRGPTWFLVGTFFGGTVTRACSIPEDVRLFFPVVNFVNINAPNVCGQDGNDVPAADLRVPAAAFVNGAVELSVILDGKPISNLVRTKSKAFAVALPEDSLFDAPCASAGGVPAGVYSPAVDDGIYVRLAPLKTGQHTLNFQAENPTAGFDLDVTYHLTVVPVRLH
jgi:hypothetical protein